MAAHKRFERLESYLPSLVFKTSAISLSANAPSEQLKVAATAYLPFNRKEAYSPFDLVLLALALP